MCREQCRAYFNSVVILLYGRLIGYLGKYEGRSALGLNFEKTTGRTHGISRRYQHNADCKESAAALQCPLQYENLGYSPSLKHARAQGNFWATFPAWGNKQPTG